MRVPVSFFDAMTKPEHILHSESRKSAVRKAKKGQKAHFCPQEGEKNRFLQFICHTSKM